MKGQVLLIGTLDTKTKEIEFLRQSIEKNNAQAIVLDVSCKEALGEVKVDYPCHEIAKAAGFAFREVMKQPRVKAAKIMAEGASCIIKELINEDKVDAVMAVGGGSGTVLGCDILRSLPLGLPKVMVSAVGAGDMTRNIGTRDIILINTAVDITLNRILRRIFINAADATVAMANRWRAKDSSIPWEGDKSLIGATMYGVTQPCVFTARDLLDAKGYEVVIFSGGAMGPTAMEEFVTEGAIDLVMDITTTSLIDEVAGGCRASGPGRLTAVGRKGTPQVVAPGAVDIINFGPPNTIPTIFHDRLFYRHTAATTLMRANMDESIQLAHLMAERLNKTLGPVAVLIPKQGFSKYDQEKGPNGMTYNGKPSDCPWYDPETNLAFIQTLQNKLNTNRVILRVIDSHINDPMFAEELVCSLLSLVKAREAG